MHLKSISACAVMAAITLIVPAARPQTPVLASHTPTFLCTRRTHIAPPPPPAHARDGVVLSGLSTPCPAGEVPQPIVSHGAPAVVAHRSRLAYYSAGAYNYFFAGMNGNYSVAYPSGVLGVEDGAAIEQPYVAPGETHSAVDLVAIAPNNGKNSIEIGWFVDNANGDPRPKIFVESQANGVYCMNGCAWVQSSTNIYPGNYLGQIGQVPTSAIEYYQGNWWIFYGGYWMGYYPGSLWSGTFTQVGQGQWFGEVATPSSITRPCSDMGDATTPSLYGSTGAIIEYMGYLDSGYAWRPQNAQSLGMTDSAFYRAGYDSTAANAFHYGGPGAC